MMSCDQHDYIEIVCTYRYRIKLTLKSDDVIQGIAVDTQRNQHKDECIKIENNGVEQLIVLDDIKQLDALDENPHVKIVVFK